MSTKPTKKRDDGSQLDSNAALQDDTGTSTVQFLAELEANSSGAVAWLRANWSKLSSDQRAAVKKANDEGAFGVSPVAQDPSVWPPAPVQETGRLSDFLASQGADSLDTSTV